MCSHRRTGRASPEYEDDEGNAEHDSSLVRIFYAACMPHDL